jgi:hypothetical protein
MSRKKHYGQNIFRTMYFDEQKNKKCYIAGFLANPTSEKWLNKGVIRIGKPPALPVRLSKV